LKNRFQKINKHLVTKGFLKWLNWKT
jgi:hypothetical protein